MAEQCHSHSHGHPSCHTSGRRDWLFITSLAVVAVAYLLHLSSWSFGFSEIQHFSHKVFDLMNQMWWGIGLSFIAVGFLNRVPKSTVMGFLGSQAGFKGLSRAVVAGVLFDLCSHGILIIGMQLYKRGASLGQTMAFLIASPWNSFSLTIILASLIGFDATMYFIIFSLVIAFISGWLFDFLVAKGILPENSYAKDGAGSAEKTAPFEWKFSFFIKTILDGVKESTMILKWIFVGTILSGILSVYVEPSVLMEYFGKNLQGMSFTLLAATVIEICSEGSVPLAADLALVAGAMGNAFIFLMAGVATDFTEIMAIRETMKSWKIAFLLPIITVPQILIWGYIINFYL